MALFPRTPRFPPEKGSEVPSPGRYNPLLHDPSQDPWRKGPLEIFKAPRNKEPDPGPDTFGLYNLDSVHDNVHSSRPRPRAISTLATPSKHHKELLRLESKLSERDSNINHLTETLHKSEKTLKDIKHNLNRSENENANLQIEVERLRKQLQGIAGLHTKVIELESEHDKSKKRRDTEISHLKAELRSAEDRASRYFNERKTVQDEFERFQASIKNYENSIHSTVQRNNLELVVYLQNMFNERHASSMILQLTKGLSLLRDAHAKKILADRASQVIELVSLVNQANSREDLLDQMLDNLVETSDLQTQNSFELVVDLLSEQDYMTKSSTELKAEMQSRQQFLDQVLREKDIELKEAQEQISLAQIELSGARSISSSLEKSLVACSHAYSDLSGVCHSQVKEINKLQDDLATRDCEMAQLQKSIQAQESRILELNDQMGVIKEQHLLAMESWQLKESQLQSSLKTTEKDLKEEKARRNKLSGELMVARQAEAALNGEAEQARYLSARIEETEQENEKLKRLNDLIMRQSNMNATEVERVEKLNTELVSQQNPAQKVKVLDRMRREIKEEKENTARLENQLWAANSEIKSLKDELSAYQSKSHPKSTSTTHTVTGTSRVTRPPLTEVVKPFEIHPTIQPAELEKQKQSSFRTTARQKTKPQPSNIDQNALTEAIPIGQKFAENPNPCRLPITQKNHQKLMRKRDELMKDTVKNVSNKQYNQDHHTGEISLGAIKMQGKMTLDELL